MNENLLKNMACTLLVCTATLLGGNFVTTNAETVKNSKAKVQAITVTNFKTLTEKVEQCVTVDESRVLFDKDKASKAGLTNQEIERLSNIYNEMNQMIKSNKAYIFKADNGNYDVKINKTSNIINADSIDTKRWYGYDFYFTPTECADAATYLQDGATAAVTIAGVLGLIGVGIPEAVVLTVGAGVAVLGDDYLWRAANHNGLNGVYYDTTGNVNFSINYN